MKNNKAPNFFGSKFKIGNIITKFNQLTEDKDDRTRRKMELALLKPEPIDPYTGPKSGPTNLQMRTIEVTFPDKIYIDKLKLFFRVGSYVKNNTYDVDWIIELLRLMEDKVILWNREKGKFKIGNKYLGGKNAIRRRIKG